MKRVVFGGRRSGAIQPERTGTPFRFKFFLENGVPVHFGKIQTELTIL
jgi:hypothetical protein